MIFCTNCWKENKENTKFCINCGNNLTKEKNISKNNTKNFLQIILNFVESRKYLFYFPLATIWIFILFPIKFFWKKYEEFFSEEYYFLKVFSEIFLEVERTTNNGREEIFFYIFLILSVIIFIYLLNILLYFFIEKFGKKVVDTFSIIFSTFSFSIFFIFLYYWNFFKIWVEKINYFWKMNVDFSILPIFLVFIIILLIIIFSVYNLLKEQKLIKWFKF